jgi:hypothetical protein
MADVAYYDFTFFPTPNDAPGLVHPVSGRFTTSDTPNALGGYDITGITGFFVGGGPFYGPITGLENNPNQPNQATTANGLWYFDNVYFPGARYVDNAGIAFYAAAGPRGCCEFNLYSASGNYYLSSNIPWTPAMPFGAYNPGWTGELFVNATGAPETSTWVMMLLGFAALGLGGYSRNRRNEQAERTARSA